MNAATPFPDTGAPVMTGDHLFNEEHEIFRHAVRRFLAEELVPNIDTWRKDGLIPREFFRLCGEQGMLCPQVPEAYGGVGGDFRFNVIVGEELARTNLAPVAFSVHSDIVAGYLLGFGSEAQKTQWLPRMVSGEVIGAIAMTEPDAGSDLQGIRTTAVRDGDDFVINGSKTFVSNGQNGDMVIVVTKTNPGQGAKGMTLFLVESDREGFRRGRNLEKIGLKEQDTSELFLDDVRVPASNMLGEEGQGFVALMKELPQERLSLSIGAVAAARQAFDVTADYVKERKAFGQPLLAFQNSRFKLAELKAQLQVAEVFVENCLARHLRGEFTAVDGAMMKLWTTELQGRVTDECLQLFGGYGYMAEYPIAHMYTDARIQRIYGGTSEIMKEIIARSI